MVVICSRSTVNPKYAEHQTKEQALREGQAAGEKVCFTKKVGLTGNDAGNKDEEW